MNRTIYFIVLLLPFAILGSLFPTNFSSDILPYLIIFYIPVISILRMKFVKFTWIEILKSMIPFYGLKYRFKVFTEK